LHIDHLVPLERSDIAMLLGSSGVVKRVKIPFKNVCENSNSLLLWWYTYGVGTFAKGSKIWLMVLVCGGSWLAILL
jgi:hypothetical protein